MIFAEGVERTDPGASDLIVVGASAGGVEALLPVVAALPADLGAAVVVVLHMGHTTSRLPALLAKRSRLPVVAAVDGMELRRRRIHVAVPGHHLLIGRDARLRVTLGPRENGHRPSIDRLFRSAARFAGRVVAVLLTGMLDDGAAGLVAVRRAGGTTVVQDPDDAAFPGMPTSAIVLQEPDHVMPLDDIPDLLARLSARAAPGAGPDRIAAADSLPGPDSGGVDDDASAFIAPTDLTCPDCHGVLRTSGAATYRCHTGHRWSPVSLLEHGAADLEAALWSALRALEEQCMLAEDLARRLALRGSQSSAERFRARAEGCRVHAATLRRMLHSDIVDRPPPRAEPSEMADREHAPPLGTI